MSDFEIGQRVTYTLASGTEARGEVVHIDCDYIHVQLDADTSELRNLHLKRIFYLDGRGTGQVWGMPEGCRGSDTGAVLQRDVPPFDGWSPTEGIAYPPEPRITYGVFDSYGRMIEPYMGAGGAVGFGIEHVRQGKRGLVRQTEDDLTLQATLEQLKIDWLQQCKVVDFDMVVERNPLEMLVGLELHTHWLYTDQFGLQFKLPFEVDRKRKRRDMVVDYSQHCLVVGMKTMTEVQEHLGAHSYGALKIKAVEGEVITLSDDYQFALLPRYKENVQPILNPAQDTKAMLMDNYVFQRLERDSTPSNDLTPVQEAIAA